MSKQLQQLTSEDLRRRFAAPLAELAVQFGHDAERLADAVQTKKVPREYMELNVKRAEAAIQLLRSFHRREVRDKLEDMLEGTYRWRDAERRAGRGQRKKRR